MRIATLGLLTAVLVNAQTLDKLKAFNAKVEAATYRAKAAIHLSPKEGMDGMALVDGAEIRDGTIELYVAGAPAAGAAEGARGFIGIAFRVQGALEKYELLYLRPTNGRAEDQLRRNHSVQYVSAPDWPWQKLRTETPGVYESYVDLEPAVWTKMRIEVAGTKAKLYVNGAAQPCLIVNDLKVGAVKGGVALWTGPGTDGYFANLRVTARP